MRSTNLEDRMAMVKLARAGHTDSEIAKSTGWSVSTVRKWRRREAQQGKQGLGSKMGRPATGALSSMAPIVRERLHAWRTAHPGWGALTLRIELEKDTTLSDCELPSRATIARWLRAKG